MTGTQDSNLIAPKESAAKPACRVSLLYVEDHPANRALVERIVERHGNFDLISAVDGNQGVALARARLPDVILMDINLPGISGLEALSILRADPATARTPIIALSSNAFPGAIENGIRAGFFRYLTKPYKIEALVDALEGAAYFAMCNRRVG